VRWEKKKFKKMAAHRILQGRIMSAEFGKKGRSPQVDLHQQGLSFVSRNYTFYILNT
jgi:hypothetical protein